MLLSCQAAGHEPPSAGRGSERGCSALVERDQAKLQVNAGSPSAASRAGRAACRHL